jgi:hypothetical protein
VGSVLRPLDASRPAVPSLLPPLIRPADGILGPWRGPSPALAESLERTRRRDGRERALIAGLGEIAATPELYRRVMMLETKGEAVALAAPVGA